MKNINLIKSVPAYRQYEIRRWLLLSITLLCGTIGGITLLQIPQLRAWYAAKQEQDHLEDCLHVFEGIMDKQHTLKQQEQQLKNQNKKLDQYTKNPKNPAKHIHMMMTACQSTVTLDGLTITKKQFKMTATTTQTTHVTDFMQRLGNNKEVENLKLVSMQQQQHGKTLQFTAQGNFPKA